MSNSFEMGPVDVKSVDSVRGSSVRGRTDSPPFLADEAVMNRMGATQELRVRIEPLRRHHVR
jgi:hypothetical protein